MTNKNTIIKALKSAFPASLPILTGFGFLGLTYGIYMNASGFNFIYTLLICITVFAGSLQFVLINLLAGAFDPLQTITITLLLGARHLFYGISMLDKYKGTGKKKLYMIFAMCDETFSVNCSADIPKGVDKGWFMFFVSLLNQLYWIVASTAGCLFGSLLNISAEGLDFVMTAMFVVIFLNQLLKEKNHIASLSGLGISLVCLLIFGADNFIIPAMLLILLALAVFRKPIEKDGEAQ